MGLKLSILPKWMKEMINFLKVGLHLRVSLRMLLLLILPKWMKKMINFLKVGLHLRVSLRMLLLQFLKKLKDRRGWKLLKVKMKPIRMNLNGWN